MSRQEMPHGRQTHCEVCGGKLDIQMRPANGSQDSAETTCTNCGRKSGFSWTSYGAREQSEQKSRFQRLRFPFTGNTRTPEIPAYLSNTGQVDISIFASDFPFPVHALHGRPHGMRLRSVGSSDSVNKDREIRRAKLTYYTGHPLEPDTALNLVETNADPYDGSREFTEFHIVYETVGNNASKEQRAEWSREGNFFGSWNLESPHSATRETIETEITGVALTTVDIATWHQPFDVAIYTFALPPTNITACSLNLSRQVTVECLRQLVVLRDNEETLTAHDEDLAETRKLIWPDR